MYDDHIAAAIAQISELTESNQERSRLKAEADKAAISTAATVNAINQNVSILASDLSVEREERKRSDDENMAYTKRRDNLNTGIAIFGVLLAIAALVISIVK